MRRARVSQEVALRLPDRPESPAHAGELLRDLVGASSERLEEARLLMHELVAAALFEGVESVEVHVVVRRGRLRLEVLGDHCAPRRSSRELTPAAQLEHHLIRDLSDRCGGDDTTLWCELDGPWSLSRTTAAASEPARAPRIPITGAPLVGSSGL